MQVIMQVAASAVTALKLAWRCSSFISEVSSKASIVVAKAELSLGCFWPLCSNSVESLRGGVWGWISTQFVLTRERF